MSQIFKRQEYYGMVSEALSLFSEKKELVIGLMITEILIGFTAIIIPVPYTLLLLILILLIPIFYMKPVIGLLCVIPFLPNYMIKFYSIGPADITPLEVTLFVAIMCWIFLCIRENKIVIYSSITEVGIFLIMSWCLFSILWSPSASRGIYQIIKMIPGLIIYYLHIHLIKDKKDFDWLLSAWIAMAVIFTIIGFIETLVFGMSAASKFIATEAVKHLTRDVRANIFFKSPDDLGFILSISIVFAIAKMATTKSKGWRILLFLSLPIMIFVLLSTFSRKSILGFVIAAAFLSWQKKKVLLSLLSISVGGLLLVVFLGSTGFLAALGNRFQSYFMAAEVAIPTRLQLWRIAIQSFAESPILGNGLGSFFVTASALGTQYGGVHSFYLFILNELGIIGFSFFLFWVFLIARRFVRFFILNTDKIGDMIGKAIIGGFLILIIQGFFRAMNYIDPIFWGLLGLSAAFLKTYMPEEAQK